MMVRGAMQIGVVDTPEWYAPLTVDPSFEEVPAAGLREELWRTARAGRWARPEGILLLEARALVKGARCIALATSRDAGNSRSRPQCLLDSLHSPVR